MENQGKTRGKKQSVSFSFEFGEIFTLSNLWISAWRLFSGIRDSFVDSRRQRFDFALTCWLSTDSWESAFSNCMH